jgi:signal transduction histidine kinase
MQLATFIEVARVPILEGAVAFARTIPALRETEERTLRDHLPQLLEAISADLRSPQSRTESIAKSQGEAPVAASQTAAQAHGLMRAQGGITIEQVVAEFRALRSSILRLWGETCSPGPDAIDDIGRFNEAIDQAVAESVQVFAQERERLRQIFLGVLGHDLRGPLNAVALTVELMRVQASAPPAQTALLARGIKRMTSLLDSLLEYTRTSLDAGMALECTPVNLGAACAEELELLRAAHPAARIEFEAAGDTEGVFDSSRVREALANLVSNAIHHGDPSEPKVVRVEGDAAAVRVSVENAGEIPAQELELLFEPLRRSGTPSSKAERTHLGLGLFIARQIARAHGGEVTGTCEGRRVRFAIELPKVAPLAVDPTP